MIFQERPTGMNEGPLLEGVRILRNREISGLDHRDRVGKDFPEHIMPDKDSLLVPIQALIHISYK